MRWTGSIDYSLNINAKKFTFWVLLIACIIFSLRLSEFSLSNLISGFGYSTAIIGEMFPPKFGLSWQNNFKLVFETLAMGFLGTIIGTIISIPLGFLSAKVTSPNLVAYNISKFLVNFLRAIPEAVYALIFVISFGFGPVAGVASLTFATIGLLSKFCAEAIESIDMKPVEAVRSTGGHNFSVITNAIFPQIFPLFAGYTFYILDANVRTAVILGILGAGGIGIEFFVRMRRFQYQEASAILLIIFIIVIIFDRVSANLRKEIINGTFLNKERKWKNLFSLAFILCLGIVSLLLTPMDISSFFKGILNVFNFLGNLFPPDLSAITKYLNSIFETISMGISGTVIAIILSIPVGFLAARNIVNNIFIKSLMSGISNLLRSIPDMVIALIFVASVGLGPFAGVLALGLHTVGFLGKFYAEAIENIDPKPLEAIDATGAKFVQKIGNGVFPQFLSLFNSYNLYVFDRNVRTSTILGIVGAGGIGFELVESMRVFQYERASTIIILILIVIMSIDWISSYLRERIV